MCACSHSIAAHLLTDDGTCGFCFCRRHLHTRRSLESMQRPRGYIVVDVLPPPPLRLPAGR